MKNHKFYHHKNETMVSVYHQGQGRTGHRLFRQLFQNLMLRACLLLLLAATALGAGAQSKITFSSNPDGNGEIYVMNADGTGQTPLTENTYADFSNPAFSPDGRKMAFTSLVEPRSSIRIMNIFFFVRVKQNALL